MRALALLAVLVACGRDAPAPPAPATRDAATPVAAAVAPLDAAITAAHGRFALARRHDGHTQLEIFEIVAGELRRLSTTVVPGPALAAPRLTWPDADAAPVLGGGHAPAPPDRDGLWAEPIPPRADKLTDDQDFRIWWRDLLVTTVPGDAIAFPPR